MQINHNLTAMNTLRQLNTASTAQGKSMEKLSSGLRINRAGDDAAGLAISEKMRGQIRGLDQASRNAQDGISLIQTGEGALNETHDILQRMRELSVQSSNDTNVGNDRQSIQDEFDQLSKEITRISSTTEFNNQTLLDGSVVGGFTFQIGANKDQNLNLSINKMDATTLGVATGTDEATTVGIDVKTQAGANTAIDLVNKAIETVSTERSKLGAYQNRLEHTINNLNTSSENLTSSESRVRDVDYALAA